MALTVEQLPDDVDEIKRIAIEYAKECARLSAEKREIVIELCELRLLDATLPGWCPSLVETACRLW